MSHYYLNDDKLENIKKDIRYTYKNNLIICNSNLGIFSKDRIDFGTNVLLNSLPDLKDVNRVLDLGCGYGIIGIAIAKAYPNLFVDLIDINERAVLMTLDNIKLNKIINANSVVSNLYENVENKYDVIVSNPPIRAGKEIVHGIIEKGYEYLNNGGFIITVIQKKQGAPSMMKKMEEVFGNVCIVNKENGYYILKSTKK